MNKYAQYFAIEKKLKSIGFDVSRNELIERFTDNKKSRLSKLTTGEYKHFIIWINQSFDNITKPVNDGWQNSPENRMRRKLYVIFVQQMEYSKEQFYGWFYKYGKFKKSLSTHTYKELVQLVSQADKVYESYLKEINK